VTDDQAAAPQLPVDHGVRPVAPRGPIAFFYAQRERDRLEANAEHDANVLASFYEDALEQDLPPQPQPAAHYGAGTGARVVVVDTAGISVVDTERSPGRDFSTRPGIAIALTGERTTGTRRSDTLDTDLLYVAVPVASSGIVHGAVRVTLDIREVNARIHRFWTGLAAVGFVVLTVVGFVGWALARSVTRPVRHLHAAATRFARGNLAVTQSPPTSVPELSALAETMNTMAARLDGLLAAQRAFVADASHQLRTPLTSMRLRLDNLESRLDDPAASADIDAIIEETTRLTAIVADLLRLARADEHQPPVSVDLARLAADRADTWSAIADAAGINLELHGPPPPLLVDAVPGAIEQILDNLLDNALNASHPGTTITVDIAPGPTSHQLRVSDQGAGSPTTRRRRPFTASGEPTPPARAPGSGSPSSTPSPPPPAARSPYTTLPVTDSPSPSPSPHRVGTVNDPPLAPSLISRHAHTGR